MSAGVVRVLGAYEGKSSISFLDAIREQDGLKPYVKLVASTNIDMIRQAATAIRNFSVLSK